MTRPDLRLEGVVLHSTDIDRLRSFYRALLAKEFMEEQHGKGPRHYACGLQGDKLLELYPSKMAVTPVSPSLMFRVPQVEEVKSRMGKYFGRVVKALGTAVTECHDSDGRNIYLHQDENQEEILLEEVIIHSPNIEHLKSFYQALFQEKVTESQHGEAKSHIFGQHRMKLKLHYSKKNVVPASPTLLFRTSRLEEITKKMKGEENKNASVLHAQGIKLYDPDGRKIILSQERAEPSWVDQLYECFIGKR